MSTTLRAEFFFDDEVDETYVTVSSQQSCAAHAPESGRRDDRVPSLPSARTRPCSGCSPSIDIWVCGEVIGVLCQHLGERDPRRMVS